MAIRAIRERESVDCALLRPAGTGTVRTVVNVDTSIVSCSF